MLPSLGAIYPPPSYLLECADRLIGGKNDAPSITAVATVWSTARHELLTPKANTAISAGAAMHGDFDTVDHYLSII